MTFKFLMNKKIQLSQLSLNRFVFQTAIFQIKRNSISPNLIIRLKKFHYIELDLFNHFRKSEKSINTELITSNSIRL